MNEWISVEDRLPDVNARVLVASTDIEGYKMVHITEMRDINPITYIKTDKYWLPPYPYFFHDNMITHWMPLPELPKE